MMATSPSMRGASSFIRIGMTTIMKPMITGVTSTPMMKPLVTTVDRNSRTRNVHDLFHDSTSGALAGAQAGPQRGQV